MFNNIVRFEKLYSFLLLYKKSLEEGFTEHRKLLRLSNELAKIEDEEYEASPPIVKRIIDIVRLYEFNTILHQKHHLDDDFEEFWMVWLARKVSQIENVSNSKQLELVNIAISYLDRNGY